MDRLHWNALVKQHAPKSGAFLQSYEWGMFQESLGRKVERILIDDDRGLLLAQAVQLDLPFGFTYWHVPKGPLGTMPIDQMMKELKMSLPSGVFLRVEPAVVPPKSWKTKEVQPATTSILDLTTPLETLYANMKPKTRYNIRLGEKQGVTARVAGLEGADDLERLLEQTAARDKFSLHPRGYYGAMLEALQGNETHASLAFAEFDGRPLAANVSIDFNGQRTYLHGASSNLHRDIKAPAFLHKFLIEDAIQKGMTSYDFWGVAPVGASKHHAWAGITQFKLGFGGEIVSAPGTFDISTNAFVFGAYRSTKILQKIRRGFRR